MILSTLLAMPNSAPRKRTTSNKDKEAQRRTWQKIAAENRAKAERREARRAARLDIRPATDLELERAERIAKKFNQVQWDKERKQRKRNKMRKTTADKLRPDRVAKRRKEAARLKRQAKSKRILRGLS